MNLYIVALKDRAADLYGKPFFVRTTAEAIRSLTDEANNTESSINKHPEDYDLYQIGTFNEETGEVNGVTGGGPMLLVRAQDLIRSTP
ncbi:MAG: nonstructural protein [Microviridae sp.]|nr:MAG: nonstructural protein [Microviridae sp.]